LQDLVHHLRTADKGRVIVGGKPNFAAYRADLHVERAKALGDGLTDPAISQNPYRLAGQFRPRRRRLTADRPLAPPLSHPERRIDLRKLAGQSQHCAYHVFGDTRLMAISIRQRCPVGQRRPIDPVKAGARHLNELYSGCSAPGLCGEHHRHQDVDLGKPRDDLGFVRHDDVARYGQVSAHRLREAGGKGAHKRDAQHGGSPYCTRPDAGCGIGEAQFPRRELATVRCAGIVSCDEPISRGERPGS
jgi:hypothetical protein